jgi:hypothetical protein
MQLQLQCAFVTKDFTALVAICRGWELGEWLVEASRPLDVNYVESKFTPVVN